ncbi:SPOR domain-containing protein [Lysobacter sp. Root494]|uniref:SPOR domain-containing protein n=1 Tax=Lysobacter sp. Root494 TaxID=1736549 RepID=UPI0006FA838F|nr:SPOR domain-containing protein [Lysobacter sp. Root494]KQY49867.1 hypothetical protein ASD14_14240 [Lysobacter sp. Root494]
MLVRTLIVLFSVLNLGVAAWWIAHDPPPPAATAQLPAGVARLQLIGEAAVLAPSPATVASAPAPMPSPSMEAITAPPAQQCFSFGPFASQNAATAAAAKLKPQVQKLTTREQAGAATPARGWRVYLPPFPSLEQAQAVAQRISAAGFDDFLVVREGAEANSIALGRYRNEEGAKKRADALIAAGFAAQTAALGEPGAASIWLDVVADEAFDPRRAQASIAAAQHRKADCPAR